jgi:hypothetical protein
MSKFIKYKEFIINIDNINYIDLESDSYGHIDIKFGEGRFVQFTKTDELVELLNSLLEDQSIKNIEK